MAKRNDRELSAQWEAYIRALRLSGVPDGKLRWHVRWAERFELFLKEKPLHEAVRDDAEAFISHLGSLPRTEPWQLQQANDAVRILLTAVFGNPRRADGPFPAETGKSTWDLR